MFYDPRNLPQSLEGAAYALRLAMACGVANAMRGEVGSVRPEDVRDVMKEIAVTVMT